MLKKAECTDPRFLEWQSVKRSEAKNMNITCYAYAVADDATIAEYAARPRDKFWRPPTIGDAWGINVKLHGIVGHMTAERVCEYAEKDGLHRLPDPPMYGPLPVASAGHRLVAIMYGERNGQFEYHTLREHNGLWSHKFGNTELPAIVDARKNVITDPREAKFYEMQKGPFFFEVPVAGIDMRLDPAFADLLDSIHIEHAIMYEQAEKRGKPNLHRPKLANHFKRLSHLISEKDPHLSKQFGLMSQLHETGKVPEGAIMRQGIFKRTLS